MITEDEAETKWCPLANAHGDSMLRGVKRDADRNWQHTLCIGSACMAWRWSKEDEAIASGYCGAFGQP